MPDIVNQFVHGKNILLVAYDAGGANQLFSIFEKVSGYKNLHVLCDGPAKNIYEQIYNRKYVQQYSLHDALFEIDIVITGTGVGSDLEYNALAASKRNGIFSVSLLDHWVNYHQRFIRNSIQVLPDEMWVVDNFAKKIVEDMFPQSTIKLVPNIYLEKIKVQIETSTFTIRNQALFLLEPIVYGGLRTNFLNPLEIFYFENFLNKWKLGSGGVTLKLRAHPSESSEKYARYLSPPTITLSDSSNFSSDLAESIIVIGYHSYGMTIAQALGKKVLCALPSGVNCKLPHNDIPRMFL